MVVVGVVSLAQWHGVLLSIGAGISEVEDKGINSDGDREEQTVYATYAIGGVTVGYQYSRDNREQLNGVSYYENDAYGISFAVNDDLSISFGNQESKTNVSGAATVDAQSLQLSYSVGGASVKVSETQVDNQNYVSGTNREGRTIAVTLAF